MRPWTFLAHKGFIYTRFGWLVVSGILTMAAAVAQPDQQKMAGASTMVFGAVSDGKKGVNFVSRGGGFYIDSRHVISNVQDCCGKTKAGVQTVPAVVGGKEDVSAGKVIWSNDDNEIAILELAQALNHPGVTISPGMLQQKGEAVYSMQYPKPGDDGGPQLVEGKLTGSGTAGEKKIPLFTTSLQLNPNNAGGALFDACANVIGMNLTMKDGQEYAFVIDPLIDALKAAGLQPNVTDQPCGGGSTSSTVPPDDNGKGDSKGKDGKEKDGKGKEGEGKEAPEGGGWRLPQGSEWIPVVIVAGLLVLAIRPARKKVAQVVTGRHTIPQPAPYPMPGVNPAGPPYAMGSAPAVPVALKPVLQGIAGEYAGVSFPLETGSSTLGRDPHAANLVFSGDASSVSKRHCSVRWDAGRGVFLLEDHGSTNGTFLASGERLAPNLPRELRAGDRFYIGDLRNQFEVAMEP